MKEHTDSYLPWLRVAFVFVIPVLVVGLVLLDLYLRGNPSWWQSSVIALTATSAFYLWFDRRH